MMPTEIGSLGPPGFPYARLMIIRAQRTGDAAVVRQLLTNAFNGAGRAADLAPTRMGTSGLHTD